MAYALQWLRSLIFNIQIYLAMAVIGILGAPWALVSRDGTFKIMRFYTRYVAWSARWLIGLRCEIRGTPPEGNVMIASKHQSFMDILMIFGALPAGKFIMKRSIIWTPIIGLYGLRIGCIAVNRGQRGKAIKKLVKDVASGMQHPGQLIIFPQGTRVAAGVKKPYKIGTGVLYEQLGQQVIPVATNIGVFWPRTGVYRKPGLAVFEFLPAIEPGMERNAFMAEMERVIEDASEKLAIEAGFEPKAD